MLRRAARALRWLVLGVLLLAGSAVLAAEVALQFGPVRAELKDRIATLAGDALDAELEIGKLEAVSLTGYVRASSVRLRNRAGAQVAYVGELRARLDPAALVRDRVRLASVTLERPWVDLGAPDQTRDRGGLLGLFRKQQPAQQAPKEKRGGGLEVAVDDLRIDDGQVSLKLAGERWSASALHVRGTLRMADALDLDVTELRARISHGQHALGELRRARGRLGPDGTARVELEAARGSAVIAARAELGAEAGTTPRGLTLTATARGVSSETLTALGLRTRVLTAPVDLTLNARGDTTVLTYDARLDTPGGAVTARGRLARESALTAQVQTERLDPRRFLRVQLAPLSGRVDVRADPAPAFPDADVQVQVARARYAGFALPETSAQGRVRRAHGVTLDRLVAGYPGGTELRASGRIDEHAMLALQAELDSADLSRVPPLERLAPGLSGTLHARARIARSPDGELSLRTAARLIEPRYREHTAQRIQLEGRIDGSELSRAHVKLQLAATELRVAGRALPYAELEVQGGPQRYRARLGLGERGALQGDVERSERGETRVHAHGRVALDRGGFVDAEVGEIAVLRGGAIALRAVQLDYRGAHVALAGELARRGASSLTAHVEAPDLAELTRPWLKQPVAGRLALDAQLEGELQAPRVRVRGRYADGVLLGVRDLDVALDADADLAARTIALHTTARSGARSLELQGQSRLPPGPLALDTALRGEHEIAIRAEDFPLHELSIWPVARAVPRTARLNGELAAQGTLERFAARFDLRSELQFRRDPTPVTVALRGRYTDTELALELQAEDRRGLLLRSRFQTELERRRFFAAPSDPIALLQQRAWQASLWVGSRRLSDWPAVRALELSPALMPAELAAHAELAHEPGKEPKGALRVRALWPPPGARSESPHCGLAHPIKLVLEADMHDGALRAALNGDLEKARVLSVTSVSHAPIDEWLRPQPLRTRPASVDLELHDLNLAELPVACERAGGSLSGRARLSREDTGELQAKVDLRAQHLRLSRAQPIDARITAEADRDALRLVANLRAENGSAAAVRGRLPLDGGGRMPTLDLDAPATVHLVLHRLDARTLLAPLPQVRARGGTLDGELSLEGPLRAPELAGKLALHDVGITLAELGQRFDRVSGELHVSDRTLHIDRLELHDRGGRGELTGQLDLSDLQRMRAELRLKAKRMPVRRSGVMLAHLDGDLRLRAELAEKRTDLYLSMRSANVELTGASLAGVQPLDPLPDVVFVDARKPDGEDEDEHDGSVTRVQLDAKEPFWIRRKDFSAYVLPQLVIEVGDEGSSVRGTIEIQRGVVELLGQLFDIQRGKIEFTGGHDAAPVLDLVAQRRAPSGRVVTLQAQGPVDEPNLTFEVDGQTVTAGEALAAATGTRVGQGGDASVQQQVGSFATGIATGALTLGARRELGSWVPVLAVEHGGAGETRLRAGVQADKLIPKFLRKVVVDAYLEGSVSTAPESDQAETSQASETAPGPDAAVLLELRFPHDLVGTSQYGPAQRWSVDVTWEP